MLTELYEYALRKNLAARPGFKPKRVKAYVELGRTGEFLGVSVREKAPPLSMLPISARRQTAPAIVTR